MTDTPTPARAAEALPFGEAAQNHSPERPSAKVIELFPKAADPHGLPTGQALLALLDDPCLKPCDLPPHHMDASVWCGGAKITFE